MAIYNLDSKELIKFPSRNLRGGTIFLTQDRLAILTIDGLGKLELWNNQGKLIANASSLVQKNEEMTLGRKKKAGPSILINDISTTAYTTFGNQLFVWSLPNLSLAWRSPEISAFGEFFTLRTISQTGGKIVLTDQSFAGNQTFDKVHTITPPSTIPTIPTIADAAAYLSDVAGIKFVEGRLIRN